MNNNLTNKKEQELKNEKKLQTKFVVRMGVSLIVGLMLGLSLPTLINIYKESSLNFGSFFDKYFTFARTIILPIIMLIAMIGYIIYASRKLSKCKPKVDAWDGEDEDYIEATDKELNQVLLVSNIFIILDQLCFGMVTYNMLDNITKQNAGIFLATIAVYFIILIYSFVTQNTIIKLTKKYAPEKKGSLYDKDFTKAWMDSCDEAEQRMIGQAAYKSYLTTSKLLSALLSISIIVGLFVPIGFWVSATLGVVWLVSAYTYSAEATRLSYRK